MAGFAIPISTKLYNNQLFSVWAERRWRPQDFRAFAEGVLRGVFCMALLASLHLKARPASSGTFL